MVPFGEQCMPKGILGGTEEAGRHVGYLTKYLTKSTGEMVEPDTAAQRHHHERLHAELSMTPRSPRCPVWLRDGIVPQGASNKTIPGRCKGRLTAGPSDCRRRVLVSRKWTGKTLPDHRADREEFVRQLLADAGISKPVRDPARLLIFSANLAGSRTGLLIPASAESPNKFLTIGPMVGRSCRSISATPAPGVRQSEGAAAVCLAVAPARYRFVVGALRDDAVAQPDRHRSEHGVIASSACNRS